VGLRGRRGHADGIRAADQRRRARYNEEATITAAVHSMLQLEYPDYDVIVVNDGSTDGTLDALIREFQLERFPAAYRARLKTEPIRGVFRSRRIPS